MEGYSNNWILFVSGSFYYGSPCRSLVAAAFIYGLFEKGNRLRLAESNVKETETFQLKD